MITSEEAHNISEMYKRHEIPQAELRILTAIYRGKTSVVVNCPTTKDYQYLEDLGYTITKEIDDPNDTYYIVSW